MMAERAHVPDATVYRLSLYHCYLLELVRQGAPAHITSGQLAEELGVKEETVRRDVSFVGDIGRPGSGYQPEVLLDAFTEFLGLEDEYPIIEIGSAEMLRALQVVFPPDCYGMRSAAYYSELAEDVGTVLNGIEIRHLSELAGLDPASGVSMALVACSPARVSETLELLDRAGVGGALLLTPAIALDKPEGMTVTRVRMPCDIKSLACRCGMAPRTDGYVRA